MHNTEGRHMPRSRVTSSLKGVCHKTHHYSSCISINRAFFVVNATERALIPLTFWDGITSISYKSPYGVRMSTPDNVHSCQSVPWLTIVKHSAALKGFTILSTGPSVKFRALNLLVYSVEGFSIFWPLRKYGVRPFLLNTEPKVTVPKMAKNTPPLVLEMYQPAVWSRWTRNIDIFVIIYDQSLGTLFSPDYKVLFLQGCRAGMIFGQEIWLIP